MGSLLFLGLVFMLPGPVQAISLTELERLFKTPPDDTRIMMRWWWFGPPVDKQRLVQEMRTMKQGGVGGFEVQPVYPVSLTGNTSYLSPEFLETIRFTAATARELGLRMDLTLGSGWPFGGAKVPIEHASARLRWQAVKPASERVPVPALFDGESLIAAFASDTLCELTTIRDGILWLDAGVARPPEVWFFIASRTGQQVKRAAIGAEGYVIDHYSRAALDHYLETVGAPLLNAVAGHPPTAIFCDSLEVYGADWTPDLLTEFQRRRGYDLRPLLPALVSDGDPRARAIRHDWGRTLTELTEERFLAPLHAWARQHKTQFRIQAYGIPPAALSSALHVDLPEGEGAQHLILRASRWASSAAHMIGQPVVSSETWTWLHSPVFRATPLDMKAEADRHFLQGINQLIGHGWPYNPEGVAYPGWRFYAAGVYNDRNPWWIVMPEVAAYMQRLSFLLRQGKPANEIAVYLPTSDAYADFKAGHVHLIEILRDRIGPELLPRLFETGHNIDFFDDRLLEQAAKGYRAIVLPGVELMPLETVRRLEEYVHEGGTLIAIRRVPSAPPGYRVTDAEKSEASAIIDRLFHGSGARGVLVDTESEVGPAIRRSLAPDVEFTPAAAPVLFVHRFTETAEIYFIANTGNTPIQMTASFRASLGNPEFWDPFTGTVAGAPIAARTSNRTAVPLHLEPYESRVVVFTPWRALPATPSIAASTLATLDLTGPWKVTFGSGAAPVTMTKLKSWTDDEGTRYFSGVASYRRDVTMEADWLSGASAVWLDFGEGEPLAEVNTRQSGPGMRAFLDAPIREAAVVYINDAKAGAVWCPPYRLEVGRLLKPGLNRLRIDVANLALNYMAGRPLPDYRLLNLRYGERFVPQEMDKVQPTPAGLLAVPRLRKTGQPASAASQGRR